MRGIVMNRCSRRAALALLLSLIACAPLAVAQEAPANPIDAYFNVQARGKARLRASLIDDRRFLRKLALDIAGVHPTYEQAQAFVADASDRKRAAAVDSLLNSQEYVYRWANFFDEMFWNQIILPNAPVRNALHGSLVEMLSANTPWDQMATRILTDAGLLVREGSASAYWLVETIDDDYWLDQVDDQAAFITETMLGVQTRCISCHDGKGHLENINVDLTQRTRREFWELAAFLSSKTLFFPNPRPNLDPVEAIYEIELVDVDDPKFSPGRGAVLVPPADFQFGRYMAESEAGQGMRPPRNGGLIEPRYPFTGETPKPGETRRQALARIIVADRQFARNMVNRVWKQFFGKGFVDPVNEWDLARLNFRTAGVHGADVQPENPLLMETLTDSFIESGFDFKSLIRLICNSEWYQTEGALLASSQTRRLEAEAILDGVAKLTGVQLPYVATGMLDQRHTNLWAMPGTIEPSPGAIYGYDGELLADPREMGYPSTEVFFAIQALTLDILRTMGRGDRVNRQKRGDEFDMQTSLALMNNPLLQYQLLGDGNGVGPVATQLGQAMSLGRSAADTVTELYLRALFREPSADELALGVAYLAESSDERAVADLMWSLVSHADFLHK